MFANVLQQSLITKDSILRWNKQAAHWEYKVYSKEHVGTFTHVEQVIGHNVASLLRKCQMLPKTKADSYEATVAG